MADTAESQFGTGLKSLDEILKGLREGDNVVWQGEKIEDYLHYVKAFQRQATDDGKKFVYFRYAETESLDLSDHQVDVIDLNPNQGFEEFMSQMLTTIESNGPNVRYAFDCISELATAWYSDRMLGNFFMLVCPYILEKRCVAYFWLKEDHHTTQAVEVIHETAQVVLDIVRCEETRYLLPIKVLDRHSPTMYMLHSCENDVYEPITKSALVADILSEVPQPWIDFNIDRRDTWSRSLIEAQRLYDQIMIGDRVPNHVDALKKRLIRMIVTRDETLAKLCEKYFDIANIICIGKRMIGTGLIGGKSVGMLLARIILKKENEKWIKRMETHDSFYLGSDVFLTYIIKNDCWWDRLALERDEPEFKNADALRDKILNGKLPEDILEELKEMLNYFGQSPIIVRSSSLLEDAYGNAFSGKYESVFCANQGTPHQRLDNLISAIKEVYASTVSKDALSYRSHRGLLGKDEQMALLIQRVSGTFYEDVYFPHLAGVAYSFNPFVWNSKIDPSQGVLRLVFGLGTHAVDSVGDDYTRIVSISEPSLRPEMDFDSVRKYTQKKVDALDLSNNEHSHLGFEAIVDKAKELPLEIFATQDREIIERARQHNMKNVFSWVLTFEKLFSETNFIPEMRELLKTIENAYNHPVDLEFSTNFIDEENFRVNVLQCRPFQISREVKQITEGPADVDAEDVIIESRGPIIGQSAFKPIHRVIYVVPEKYGEMSMSQRHSVARLVGELTNKKEKDQKIMLVGPGRWGTTMPALGVPVSFAEIKYASVLCEIVAMHEGLTPDISLGTHFFNDMVEVNIVYMALFPDKEHHVLNKEFLMNAKNLLPDILPESKNWADSIRVIDTAATNRGRGVVHVDAVKQRGILYLAE